MTTRLRVQIGQGHVQWVTKDVHVSLERYLRGFRTNYFSYVLEQHVAGLQREEYEQVAATALRQLYFQCLETTIAVWCAFLQCPLGLPAWMLRYQNSDLKFCAKRLAAGEALPGGAESFSVEDFALELFTFVVRADGERLTEEERSKEAANVARTLRHMLDDFNNVNLHDEYNSLKHGYRVRGGPVELRFKFEETGDWRYLRAPFASTFPLADSKAKEFRVKSRTLGFDPKRVAKKTEAVIGVLELLLGGLAAHCLGASLNRVSALLREHEVHKAWVERPEWLELLDLTEDLDW